MGLVRRPVLPCADAGGSFPGGTVWADLSRDEDFESADQFQNAGQSEFPRLLRHYLLRVRRTLCELGVAACAIAIAFRLRFDDVRSGIIAGGRIFDHHAIHCRDSAGAWGGCTLSDGGGAGDSGARELLD